jgi:hypothetical protein
MCQFYLKKGKYAKGTLKINHERVSKFDQIFVWYCIAVLEVLAILQCAYSLSSVFIKQPGCLEVQHEVPLQTYPPIGTTFQVGPPLVAVQFQEISIGRLLERSLQGHG